MRRPPAERVAAPHAPRRARRRRRHRQPDALRRRAPLRARGVGAGGPRQRRRSHGDAHPRDRPPEHRIATLRARRRSPAPSTATHRSAPSSRRGSTSPSRRCSPMSTARAPRCRYEAAADRPPADPARAGRSRPMRRTDSDPTPIPTERADDERTAAADPGAPPERARRPVPRAPDAGHDGAAGAGARARLPVHVQHRAVADRAARDDLHAAPARLLLLPDGHPRRDDAQAVAEHRLDPRRPARRVTRARPRPVR